MKQAIILAAGKGTRLQPVESTRPKPMVQIGGKPVLEHTIRHLKKHGYEYIVITLGHMAGFISHYFLDGQPLNVHIRYSHEPELLGTGGGLRKASKLLMESKDPVLIWNGDNLCSVNLTKMEKTFNELWADGLIAVDQREDPYKSGVLKLNGNGRVTNFYEKPGVEQWQKEIQSHWINAGIMLLKPNLISYIAPDKEMDLGRDVFPLWLSDHCYIYAYELHGYEQLHWYDTPEELAKLRKEHETY